MQRVFWFFAILLIWGCENKLEANGSKLISIQSYLSDSEFNLGQVSLFGYLVKKNEIFFIYENEEFSNFSGSDVSKLRMQVFLPPSQIAEKCLGRYVSLYGRAHSYIGAISIDDVSRISLMEDGSICYSSVPPVNYFSVLRSNN
ncbi:hypothetical protein ACJJIG_00550 [Microbulbifer sp. SSSA007]|uniref:hypothetical protein n=1 Tax=Microbulbifer sp. SSSA007 TaxID=3243379 RepID=UPI00403A6C1B